MVHIVVSVSGGNFTYTLTVQDEDAARAASDMREALGILFNLGAKPEVKAPITHYSLSNTPEEQ